MGGIQNLLLWSFLSIRKEGFLSLSAIKYRRLYLSPSLVYLTIPNLKKKKRLVVIAVLSVSISQVTPLPGHASVHVVKAIYEQWPDMKPRLLWSCKQPHLFEPTCSPVFTSLINNEISLGNYYYCIRNIAVATLLQKVCTNARYTFKTISFSSCASDASDPRLLISACSFFIYLAPCLFSF